MLRTEMRMPRLEMSFKGFTLNDVMPSSAKEIKMCIRDRSRTISFRRV